MKVNNKEYKIIKLLGKGKSGYSYLACCEDVFYTLKKIHHEPCDYYTFTNKIESELRDYQTLSKLNILMPELIDVDKENEIIVKEYLTGKTVLEKISADEDISLELKLIKEIAEHLKTIILILTIIPVISFYKVIDFIMSIMNVMSTWFNMISITGE